MSTINTLNLPDLASVRSLFSSLFGQETTTAASETPVSHDDTCIIATYCNDSGEPKRIIVCNGEFANRAGAALTMFPVSGANEAIKAKEITESHLENFHEVLNICVNLFPQSSGSRLVLGEVHTADDARNKLSELSTTTTVSFDVDIPRYGTGLFSLSTLQDD
jgi:hypothetical protein